MHFIGFLDVCALCSTHRHRDYHIHHPYCWPRCGAGDAKEQRYYLVDREVMPVRACISYLRPFALPQFNQCTGMATPPAMDQPRQLNSCLNCVPIDREENFSTESRRRNFRTTSKEIVQAQRVQGDKKAGLLPMLAVFAYDKSCDMWSLGVRTSCCAATHPSRPRYWPCLHWPCLHWPCLCWSCPTLHAHDGDRHLTCILRNAVASSARLVLT